MKPMIRHYRLIDERELMPFGGATVVACAPTDEPGAIFLAAAVCSMQDNFRYATGRNKALARAARGQGLTLEATLPEVPDWRAFVEEQCTIVAMAHCRRIWSRMYSQQDVHMLLASLRLYRRHAKRLRRPHDTLH